MSTFDYNTNPPSYTDPSAADDISSLIHTALKIQEELSDARIGLKAIDAVAGTELLQQLLQIDEKYLSLLDESRSSANELRSDIEVFIEYLLPYVRDTSNPDRFRLMYVREYANLIARSARDNLKPHDEQLETLRGDLKILHDSLVEVRERMNGGDSTKSTQSGKQSSTAGEDVQVTSTDTLTSEGEISSSSQGKPVASKSDTTASTSMATPVRQTPSASQETSTVSKSDTTASTSMATPVRQTPSASQETSTVSKSDTTASTSMVTSVRQTPSALQETSNFPTSVDAVTSEMPASMGTLSSTEERSSAPQGNSIVPAVSQLPASKGQTMTSSGTDAVLNDISVLINSISGLIGKLGNFSVIWEKLINDSSELSIYMADGRSDLDVIGNRVEAEAGVYIKVMRALDNYCLQS